MAVPKNSDQEPARENGSPIRIELAPQSPALNGHAVSNGHAAPVMDEPEIGDEP